MKKITKQMLDVYKHFNGDIDDFLRIGNSKEKEILSGEDFVMITNILQSLHLIKDGLASKDFEQRTMIELDSICENRHVQNILRELL